LKSFEFFTFIETFNDEAFITFYT